MAEYDMNRRRLCRPRDSFAYYTLLPSFSILSVSFSFMAKCAVSTFSFPIGAISQMVPRRPPRRLHSYVDVLYSSVCLDSFGHLTKSSRRCLCAQILRQNKTSKTEIGELGRVTALINWTPRPEGGGRRDGCSLKGPGKDVI